MFVGDEDDEPLNLLFPFVSRNHRKRDQGKPPRKPEKKKRRGAIIFNCGDDDDTEKDPGLSFPRQMDMHALGPGSLRELMQFPITLVRTIMQTRFAANFVRNISARARLRTQYSGIGTFEWAFCLLEQCAEMLELINPAATFIILREACDKDDRCLNILATYDGESSSHPPCLYGNVMSRLCPAAQHRLRGVEWPTPEIYDDDSLVAVHMA